MSTRFNGGSHYENHQRAKELHDGAAHVHRIGERQGKQEHLTGQELSRQALQHSGGAQKQNSEPTVGHGIAAFGHDEIQAVAHELWRARGCPEGSPEQDWFEAVKELRSRARALKSPELIGVSNQSDDRL